MSYRRRINELLKKDTLTGQEVGSVYLYNIIDLYRLEPTLDEESLDIRERGGVVSNDEIIDLENKLSDSDEEFYIYQKYLNIHNTLRELVIRSEFYNERIHYFLQASMYCLDEFTKLTPNQTEEKKAILKHPHTADTNKASELWGGIVYSIQQLLAFNALIDILRKYTDIDGLRVFKRDIKPIEEAIERFNKKLELVTDYHDDLNKKLCKPFLPIDMQQLQITRGDKSQAEALLKYNFYFNKRTPDYRIINTLLGM